MTETRWAVPTLRPWHRWLAGGCVVATALALAWALATALLVRLFG